MIDIWAKHGQKRILRVKLPTKLLLQSKSNQGLTDACTRYLLEHTNPDLQAKH